MIVEKKLASTHFQCASHVLQYLTDKLDIISCVFSGNWDCHGALASVKVHLFSFFFLNKRRFLCYRLNFSVKYKQSSCCCEPCLGHWWHCMEWSDWCTMQHKEDHLISEILGGELCSACVLWDFVCFFGSVLFLYLGLVVTINWQWLLVIVR